MRQSRLLLISALAFVSLVGADVTARRTLMDFGAAERWHVHGSGRGMVKLTTGKDGGLLELTPCPKKTQVPLTERKFSVTTLGSVSAVELVADLETGDGVEFNIRLKDRDGEIGQLKGQMLKPGKNVLRWDVPTDLKFGGTWGADEAKRNGVLELPLHLHELFLFRHQTQKPARVRLHALRVVDRCAPAEAIGAELEAGNEIHIIDANKPEQIPALVLGNAAEQDIPVQATVRITDFAGTTQNMTRKVTVPAGASTKIDLPRSPSQGVFYVDYELVDAEGTKKNGKRSFAIMDPAGPTEGRADGFLFSICTHTERWGARDQRLEVMAAGMCGAKVVRTGSGWGSIERREGEFDWSHFDRIVKMYGDQGMEIQCLLAFTPRWAAAPGKQNSTDWHEWNNSMPREDAWRRWVRKMAERYGDRIRYWEVWNEPDIGFWRGTLDEYLVLLQSAYEEIKSVDPKLQVMTGGFAIYHRNPDFIEAVVDRGQKWFDIFAYHRHGGFVPFQQEVDGPVAKMRARMHPPKPIYFNETAIASIGIGERGQAETLVKKLSFAWARGSIGYTWYDLRNDGFDPTEYEHNYGMVTNDFYPKAVYPTYNTLVQQLRGKEFVKQLDLGEGRWGFAFADQKETVIVAWNESRNEVDEHYLLSASGVSRTSIIDMMNNASPGATPTADRVSLSISREPRFLRLDGRHPELKVLGPELKLASVSPAVPGQVVQAELAIHNLYTQPREYVATWQLPKEMGSGKGEQHATIPADTLGTLSLRIPIPASLRGQYGSAFRATLSIAAAGQKPFATMNVPIPLAAYVPKDGAKPVFRLDSHSQVTNLFAADPNKKHLVWTGPKDLSATARLRIAGDRLLFEASVRDDRHHQPKTGKDVWQGDGIQLAMAVPGQAGFWEVGLTQLNDGKPEVCVWHKPNGFADPTKAIALETTTQDDGVLYRASLPLKELGLTVAKLREGIRLSFLVNDNDGSGRESWVEVSDGIGHGKDPSKFPFVVFE